jgi:hypothetical protein
MPDTVFDGDAHKSCPKALYKTQQGSEKRQAKTCEKMAKKAAKKCCVSTTTTAAPTTTTAAPTTTSTETTTTSTTTTTTAGPTYELADPSSELVKKDAKCVFDSSRLFRKESINTVDACEAACDSYDGCKFFSYLKYVGTGGICMGCSSIDKVDVHKGFDMYSIGGDATCTTTTTVDECKAAAVELGKKFATGSYTQTVGCYGYPAGQYADTLWFSTYTNAKEKDLTKTGTPVQRRVCIIDQDGESA